MNILALDPANKCGYATSFGLSGVWDFTPKRDESKGYRLLLLRSKLTYIQENFDHPLDLVVFEAARNAGPKRQGALVVQSELQGVIKLWCEEREIEYRGYSPKTIKKHATGNGNANKKMMVNAAQEFFNEPIESDDHADAMWLLHLVMEELGLHDF